MSLTLSVGGDHRGYGGRFRWEEAAGIWAGRAAPLGQRMLRAHAPFLTGAFREGIKVREEPGPGRHVIMFYSQAFYARFILEGTKPHVIVPRNARVLRWVAHRGHGQVMYAMRVQHPGTKPDPFPERAFAPIGIAVSEMFARAVKESMRL